MISKTLINNRTGTNDFTSEISALDDSFLDGIITPSLDHELKVNLDSSRLNRGRRVTPAFSNDQIGTNLYLSEMPKDTHTLDVPNKYNKSPFVGGCALSRIEEESFIRSKDNKSIESAKRNTSAHQADSSIQGFQMMNQAMSCFSTLMQQ